MKKILNFIFLFTLAFSIFTQTCAAAWDKGNPSAGYYDDNIILPDKTVIDIKKDHPVLFINGTLITEYEVIIRNGRSLVPVRLASEELGAVVSWDGAKREVEIQKGLNEILLSIDRDKAKVNGREISLDHSAVIYKDRTYVPLRFVADNLDASVSYEPEMDINVYKQFYETSWAISPANTIVRDRPNIMIDEKYPGEAAPQKEAMARSKEVCLEGLENFKKSIIESLASSGEPEDRMNDEFKDIERQVGRMLYIGEVSRFYKFTMGPYEILYDKYNGRMFFEIYSDGILIKEVDIHDPGLFSLIFIIG
ncbi:MAG: copper amine oxidase N-terminal domain-containing protein [Clostridiales bacterium]|nr:copper amine oxidase N-terminal domain-containing protein [Clostridiales bacterium]